MKAKDVMTSSVVTVEPDTPVKNIATLLFERHISAVPVVAGGRLVGMVSEADLLHRHELGTDRARPRSWWLRMLDADRSLEQYIKSHGRRARDIMTREVVAVTPDTPLSDVARLFHERRINRVPVVQDGRLAGIVSRSDLVRALASARRATKGTSLSDKAIRARLLQELGDQTWWRRGRSFVAVAEGVVTYTGTVESQEERDAARIAAENIPQVRGVKDRRLMLSELPVMS